MAPGSATWGTAEPMARRPARQSPPVASSLAEQSGAVKASKGGAESGRAAQLQLPGSSSLLLESKTRRQP